MDLYIGRRLSLLAVFTFLTVIHHSHAEALGVNCNVDQKVNFGDKKVITYNGTAALNTSCNRMTFRSTDQLMLCIQATLFKDPDCAVELRFTNTKDRKMEIFNCKEYDDTFCTKSNGTLEIQINSRDGKSPRNAELSMVLFTKNATKDDDDDSDWQLLTILLRVLIPLFFILVSAIIFGICFYKQRKKSQAEYLGKSGTGSNVTPFSFGSPALENYPAPPPQPQQPLTFGVNR